MAAGSRAAQQVTEGLAGEPRPENLAQIGRWLSQRRNSGVLYFMALRDGDGMRSTVDTLNFLPPR